MGKSFRDKNFYDTFDDMEDEDILYSKSYRNKKNDKKMEIQRARKKAQAERDKAIAEFVEGSDTEFSM